MSRFDLAVGLQSYRVKKKWHIALSMKAYIIFYTKVVNIDQFSFFQLKGHTRFFNIFKLCNQFGNFQIAKCFSQVKGSQIIIICWVLVLGML
jgi:hypothetical protein